MLGHRGVLICAERKRRFVVSQSVATRHPGSKRPANRNYRCAPAGSRHNQHLMEFSEWCYERGLLSAVRRDFR